VRVGDTTLLTGRLVRIAGLDIYKTTNLPAGVDAMVLDSRQLGSIGWEDLGGGYHGYRRRGAVEADPQGGEGRLADQRPSVGVPMVQEPGAAVKITST
jgi:hypothetical protein